MLRFVFSIASLFLLANSTLAQTTPTTSKPRVFISDSQSWEMSGSAGGSGGTFAAHSQGGARPQTAEIVKTFGERCPDVTVNNKADRSDYVVLLDHEGGKGYARRDNKVAVFNSDGDAVLSHSTRELGNAVKDACDAIGKDWTARAGRASSPEKSLQPAGTGDKSGASVALVSSISVSSSPSSADIELDGNFVGNTPSTVAVAPGDHVVVVKRSGYKPWERKLKVTGGTVTITAELEKSE